MQSELVILCLYLLNANTQYQVNIMKTREQYYCVCNLLIKCFLTNH